MDNVELVRDNVNFGDEDEDFTCSNYLLSVTKFSRSTIAVGQLYTLAADNRLLLVYSTLVRRCSYSPHQPGPRTVIFSSSSPQCDRNPANSRTHGLSQYRQYKGSLCVHRAIDNLVPVIDIPLLPGAQLPLHRDPPNKDEVQSVHSQAIRLSVYGGAGATSDPPDKLEESK